MAMFEVCRDPECGHKRPMREIPVYTAPGCEKCGLFPFTLESDGTGTEKLVLLIRSNTKSVPQKLFPCCENDYSFVVFDNREDIEKMVRFHQRIEGRQTQIVSVEI